LIHDCAEKEVVRAKDYCTESTGAHAARAVVVILSAGGTKAVKYGMLAALG